MHGICGVPSQDNNKRFQDNDIMYACKCHMCTADTTNQKASASSARAPQKQSGTAQTRSESKMPARASAGTEGGNMGEKRSHSEGFSQACAKQRKRVDRSQSFWEDLCRKFTESGYTNKSAFLDSAASGHDISAEKHRRSFCRALDKYNDGKLKKSDRKRDRQSDNEPIKEQLLSYTELRSRLYQQDRCGLSYSLLKEKSEQFAKNLGYENFVASNGFISRCLKGSGKASVALHGEGMEMTPEEQHRLHVEFRQRLQRLMEEKLVGPSRIYNADQTGLYFNKLPNRIYINKSQKNNFRGVKQMKSKDRVTLMICTSADGEKAPLFMVGKSANPTCFKYLSRDGRPPMAYTHQSNAWFDRAVTIEWINRVFWPHHLQRHGNIWAILLLDNCSAHKDLDASLPKKLLVVFFPPNCTSFIQPADMGMIACLKVGYKALMLRKLLTICDDPQMYDQALKRNKTMRRGCAGLECAGKAHLKDAMDILNEIWNNDGKYAKRETVLRCWRKANILPAILSIDINVEAGSSMPERDKRISKEDCEELCLLLSALSTKSSEHNCLLPALRKSFAEEESSSVDDLQSIVYNWALAEDNLEFQQAEIDEAIEVLERGLDKDDDLGSDDEGDSKGEDHMEISPNGSEEKSGTWTWNEFADAITTCQKFLVIKRMEGDALDIGRVEASVRAKRLSAASSQLSIRSFFKPN
ncbi:MAG: hypothetical protein ACREOZ_04185 [Gloeomargaritales cyanobacterium]